MAFSSRQRRFCVAPDAAAHRADFSAAEIAAVITEFHAFMSSSSSTPIHLRLHGSTLYFDFVTPSLLRQRDAVYAILMEITPIAHRKRAVRQQ